ncbi:hypothetical protein OESDEN_06879 [Oesophagostomum dentatum]|uniref:SCP domain-containing protein n=1 Tax=Oesophagostomum dentatum TaxID=61180 RepID=A0A0B1TCZ2_OESDE|nr:hypothetical protein OESDEN_06879 [Oesophagostomum dentatum]
MANARATEIGCSVTKCGNKMQIGCLYNAIGNVKGQPMWETGEPCSECVGNATCEDGLCARPEEKPGRSSARIIASLEEISFKTE